VTAVIEAEGVGRRYRRLWALNDCTLSIPAGHVVGLVGPNGAGKTTLLNLATGMLAPTAGTIEVLGGRPAAGPAQLARVGYLAQDAPVYAGLSVADHLRLGAHLNPAWDAELARSRIERLDLDPGQKAGTLSGGQCAQLALTLAVAKRPEVLILDEPVASLDPLARREFLKDLMGAVAEQGLSVVLSSHLISDLERVCDYLIVLVASRVRVAGTVGNCWTPTTCCPARAATRARCRPGSTSSPPATPTGRPRSWCAPPARFWTRPGRPPRSAWKTWCWPT
jgi:ABC-2 type transport system ATP-binding protein